MATRGRGRFGGALVGSVARSVLQRADSPVIALGPSADNPGWSPRPRNGRSRSGARIVACVDGGTTSEQVGYTRGSNDRTEHATMAETRDIDGACPAPSRP